MRNLIRKENGDVAIFSAILIPSIILVFMFLVSKMDLFNIKQEIKYYTEISAKIATDTAIVMEDTKGQNICVILNDRSTTRNSTYEQTTETLYSNLTNPHNKSIKLGSEVKIVNISTEDVENAWGWNRDLQRFERPSSMVGLNDTFKNGRVSIIVKGYFKPKYLPIPDFWKGYYFEIPVSASCLS